MGRADCQHHRPPAPWPEEDFSPFPAAVFLSCPMRPPPFREWDKVPQGLSTVPGAQIVVIVDSHHQCNIKVREESRHLMPETPRPQAAVTSSHQCV